ncbi:MAG: esterase family protein [Lachnospiraceae bacterium]|nr:esterase family protein [Lachnospiraceae bacterium]
MAIVSLDMYSYELAMNTQVSMILPERRGVPCAVHTGDYPILYLLHGHGQDHTSWLRLSRIELYLQNTDVIVVMPNIGRSFYVDGVNTHHYGSYLTEELPRALRNWFHLSSDREHTFIAGMSMGGYGALHAALSHPEVYGGVCAMSAVIQPWKTDFRGRADKGIAIPVTPEINQNIANIFGPGDSCEGSSYDLQHLAQHLNASEGPKPRILQVCGDDDPLYAANEEFAKFMQEKCPNIDYTWQPGDGIHDFYFWDRETVTMLEFFGLLP